METRNDSTSLLNETTDVLLRPVSPCSNNPSDRSQQEQGLNGLLIREVDGRCSKSTKGHDLQKRENVFKTWGLELLTLGLAFGLLTAICILLAKHNNQVQPNWGNPGFTLNALIATLALLFRASLGFISYEILAQVKWNWISQQFRPVRDFELIDAASRGIYGSLCLLPLAARHQPQAFVAIFVAITSLGTGPFMQQTVQTYQCRRVKPSGDGAPATITTANSVDFFKIGSDFIGGDTPQNGFNMQMQTAMQDAIVNPTNDSNIGALFTCQTGNCTFPLLFNGADDSEEDRITHSSIGMCNQCVDVYDYVQGPEPYTFVGYDDLTEPSFTLPVYFDNSPRAEEQDPMRIVLGRSGTLYDYMQIRNNNNLTWTNKTAPRAFINRARWSVYNFTILAASTDHCSTFSNGSLSCPHSCWNGTWTCEGSPLAFYEPSNYVAAACTVYPCLKHYRATVEAGKLVEKVVRDTPLIRELGRASEYQAVQQPCLVNGTLYTSANMSSSGERLGVNATDTVLSLADDWEDMESDRLPSFHNITAPNECIGRMEHRTIVEFKSNPFYNVTCEFDLMGRGGGCRGTPKSSPDPASLVALMRQNETSMGTIRENIDSLTLRITTELRKRGQGALLTGDEWESNTCVRVVWGWLALPAATLLLCSIVLLWTIIKEEWSKNGNVWKSSPLPALLRGYPGLERMRSKDMAEIAKGLEMKIEKDKLN